MNWFDVKQHGAMREIIIVFTGIEILPMCVKISQSYVKLQFHNIEFSILMLVVTVKWKFITIKLSGV